MTDYTDLIARLRMIASILRPLPNIRLSECDTLDQAADAIAALQAEVARPGQQTTGDVAQADKG